MSCERFFGEFSVFSPPLCNRLNTSYLSRKQQRRKKSALLGNEWTKRLIIFSRFHFHRLLAECYEVTSAYEWPYSSACNFFSEASNARYAIESRNKFREKIRSIFLESVSSNDKRDNINFYRLDWFIDPESSLVNNYLKIKERKNVFTHHRTENKVGTIRFTDSHDRCR